jgi:predicted MFS family arabinose efflux permease
MSGRSRSRSAPASARVVMYAWLWRRRRLRRAVGETSPVRLRRARIGVTVAFAFAGALCGVFTARIPALMDDLAMSPAQLGGVLFMWGLGAVATMQALRWVMAHTGSAPVLRAAAPLYVLGLALVGGSQTYAMLLVAVGVFGMGFGAVEVAANAQGATVEREYGRAVVVSMHAGWPIGAAAGGLAAAWCAHLGISYTQTLVGAALITLPVALSIGGTLLDTRQTRTPGLYGRSRQPIRPAVYLLGIIGFAALVIEGAVTDWSGVLLHDGLGASQFVAALAYPMFQGGMLTGRVAADRLQTRLLARTIVVYCGLATTACFLIVTSASQPLVVLAAVYGVGVAISPVLPLAFSLAGGYGSERSDATIAQLGVIAYAGILAGPALIGAITGAGSLRMALVVTAVALGATIVAMALALPAAPQPDGNATPRHTVSIQPQS